MYYEKTLKLYFHFLQIVQKIHAFRKINIVKSFVEQAKLTNYLICFLPFRVLVKILSENCQNYSIHAVPA